MMEIKAPQLSAGALSLTSTSLSDDWLVEDVAHRPQVVGDTSRHGR